MRARELLGIFGGLGPAIIKAGQALSSRPDLLPKDYLDELQKLQVTDMNQAHKAIPAFDTVSFTQLSSAGVRKHVGKSDVLQRGFTAV